MCIFFNCYLSHPVKNDPLLLKCSQKPKVSVVSNQKANQAQVGIFTWICSSSNWGSESDDSQTYHNGNSDPRGFGKTAFLLCWVDNVCLCWVCCFLWILVCLSEHRLRYSWQDTSELQFLMSMQPANCLRSKESLLLKSLMMVRCDIFVQGYDTLIIVIYVVNQYFFHIIIPKVATSSAQGYFNYF